MLDEVEVLVSESPEFGVLTVEQFVTGEIPRTQLVDNILTDPLLSNSFGAAVDGNTVENGLHANDGLVLVVFHAPIIPPFVPCVNAFVLFYFNRRKCLSILDLT